MYFHASSLTALSQSLTCQAHTVHRACSYHATHLLIQTYKHSRLSINHKRHFQVLHSVPTCLQNFDPPGTRDGTTEPRCTGTGSGLSARLAWLVRPVPHWYTQPESEGGAGKIFWISSSTCMDRLSRYEKNVRVAARECLSPAATLTTGSFRLWQAKHTKSSWCVSKTFIAFVTKVRQTAHDRLGICSPRRD